jgi:hypothetical protein
MKTKQLLIIWILLLFLTLVTAAISNYYTHSSYVVEIIITIAVLKFIAVSFYFMEIKNAHLFWKISILTFLLIFSTIIFAIN